MRRRSGGEEKKAASARLENSLKFFARRRQNRFALGKENRAGCAVARTRQASPFGAMNAYLVTVLGLGEKRREFGRRHDHMPRHRLAIDAPNEDMRAGVVGGMQPYVVRTGKAKCKAVIVAIRSSDQNFVIVGTAIASQSGEIVGLWLSLAMRVGVFGAQLVRQGLRGFSDCGFKRRVACGFGEQVPKTSR